MFFFDLQNQGPYLILGGEFMNIVTLLSTLEIIVSVFVYAYLYYKAFAKHDSIY